MKDKFLLPILLLLVISAALIFSWFKGGLQMGTAESGAPFYNLARSLHIVGWSWSDAALGADTSLIVGTAPTYWFLTLLQEVGLPGFLIEALLFFVLIGTATISVYYLTLELFPELNWKAGVLAALFYLFNPYPIANIWARFLINHMFAYAALPLLWLFYIKGVKRQNYVFGIIVAVAAALFAFALTSMPITLIVWGIFSLTTVTYLVLCRTLKEAGFLIKFFFLTLISYLVVNAWWFGQLFAFSFSKSKDISVGNFFSAQGNLDTLLALSQNLGLLTNSTRFLHGSFFAQGQEWAKFFVNLPMSIIAFIFTGIIFWAIYVRRKNKEVLLIGSLFIIGLYLTKGSNLPFGEMFEFLFVHIPPLQVFRNPFEKFGFILILAAAPLLAVGVSQIDKLIKSKFRGYKDSWQRAIYGILFVFLVFAWGYPFWTSQIFSSNERVKAEDVKSFRIQIPEYYKQANQWFNNQPGNFRFLSLPLGGEGVTYNWEKPYVGVDLSSTFFDVPNISNNTTVSYYSDFVASLSSYQLNESLMNFMPFLNGKYILVRNDISYKDDHVASPTVIENRMQDFVKKGLVSEKTTFGKLKIYQVNDRWYWPKIFIASGIVVGNKVDLVKSMTMINPSFPDDTLAIIDKSAVKNTDNFPNLVINPEKTYSPIIGNTGEYNFTDDQLLVKLLWAKYLPGGSGYSLSRIKEDLEVPTKDDYWKRLSYQIDLLGKRAVELYRMKQQSFNPNVINDSEDEYIDQLGETMSDSKNNTNPYLPDTLKEKLLVQYILARKMNSKIQDQLKNILKDFNIIPQFDLPKSDNRYQVYRFQSPADGSYKLTYDKSQERATWFLDGQTATSSALLNSEGTFKLQKGIHEVAVISPEDSGFLSDIYSSDYLQANEDKGFNHEIAYLDQPEDYSVEFDFRFREGGSFNLVVNQDIDKTPLISQEVSKDPSFHDWQHFGRSFTSSVGATKAQVQFMPEYDYTCNHFWRIDQNCSYTIRPYNIEIKNLRIRRINQINPVLISANFNSNQTQSKTTWQWVKVNPTLYQAKIDKKDNNQEMLVFSELYDARWQVTVSKDQNWNSLTEVEDWKGRGKQYAQKDNNQVDWTTEQAFSGDNHYLVNTYANGWLLTKPGIYNINIEFAPQQVSDIGKKISLFSGLAMVISVSGLYFWQRRRKDG